MQEKSLLLTRLCGAAFGLIIFTRLLPLEAIKTLSMVEWFC